MSSRLSASRRPLAGHHHDGRSTAPGHLAPGVVRGLIGTALVATFAFTACAGSDDTAAANDSIVLPEKVSARSEPTDQADDATVPSVSAVPSSSDLGMPLVTSIELDPCLVGTWAVSVDTVGLLIAAAVLPVSDLTLVDGGFDVSLSADGGATAEADFTAAFSVGQSPAEADVSWSGAGTWSTFDGVVTLSLDEQDGGLTEVRLDGAPQAGSQLDVDLPLSGGTYECTATRLEVSGRAGGTAVPLVLER